MKLRKILALVSAAALTITATVFSPMMSASADGATYKLVQGEKYDMGGGAMAIPVDVYVTLPETFSQYNSKFSVTPTPGTYYTGRVLQFLSIEIPYIDGLMYIGDASMSSIKDEALAAAGCAINDNATDQKVQIFMNQQTPASMYYGELNHVATLTYFVTGTADSYVIEPSDVYACVYSWDGTTTSTATPINYAMDSFNQTVEAEKYAVTVSGGTADVTEAEEGQTVTVTADVPAGKVIGSIDASVDYTDNENGTYTFKMPAEAVTFTINYVDEVVEFEATATKSATKYYTGVAEDVKEIQVFDVTVANSSLAKWIFTFASASANDSRTFTPDMSSFGDSTVEFDAWIVGAPADVTLTVE